VIFKHKNSYANLDGWQLLQQSFPVEPDKYFKGGADIYRKTFMQGQLVEIPGSKIQGEGYANLVFVQYRASNYVHVTNPRGTQLISSTPIRLSAVILKDAGVSIEWHYRIEDGNWVNLGTGLNIDFNVPTVEQQLKMELQLMLLNVAGQVITTKTVDYTLLK
jgi:hypothetical protein